LLKVGLSTINQSNQSIIIPAQLQVMGHFMQLPH